MSQLTIQQSEFPERLAIDNVVIDEVALRVSQIQQEVISEERVMMQPVLRSLCDKLLTAVNGDQVAGICRGVGFAAAHQIVRRCSGKELINALQDRETTTRAYVDNARRNPSITRGDFETIFRPEDTTWTDLRRFVTGDLRPGEDSGHGCTNKDSSFSARVMFVLAGSIGLPGGSVIYQRAAPPFQQPRSQQRLTRQTHRPGR